MSYCRNCGHEIPEGCSFCPKCGEQYVGDNGPLKKESKSVMPILGMILGIVSIAGCAIFLMNFWWMEFLPVLWSMFYTPTFVASVLGLVFSLVGKKAPNAGKKTRIGVGFSIAGLVISVGVCVIANLLNAIMFA